MHRWAQEHQQHWVPVVDCRIISLEKKKPSTASQVKSTPEGSAGLVIGPEEVGVTVKIYKMD